MLVAHAFIVSFVLTFIWTRVIHVESKKKCDERTEPRVRSIVLYIGVLYVEVNVEKRGRMIRYRVSM